MSLPSVPRPERGFTLLEVLVAAALTAALAAVLFGVVVQVGELAERSAARLEAEAQARRVFALLTRDLESLVLRRDGQVWLSLAVVPDDPVTGMRGETWAAVPGAWRKPDAAEGSLRLGSEVIASDRFGRAGVRLVAVSAHPADGRPAVVSYQLVRRRNRAAEPAAYQLYRSWVSPEETWAAGYDLGEARVYWEPDDTPQRPGNVTRPPEAALLAEHVVDFGVRLVGAAGQGPVAPLFPPAAAPWRFEYDGSGAAPVTAELMLRILPRSAAERLARLEAHADAAAPAGLDWWTFVETHSYLFTRRVRVMSQPW